MLSLPPRSPTPLAIPTPLLNRDSQQHSLPESAATPLASPSELMSTAVAPLGASYSPSEAAGVAVILEVATLPTSPVAPLLSAKQPVAAAAAPGLAPLVAVVVEPASQPSSPAAQPTRALQSLQRLGPKESSPAPWPGSPPQC